MLVSNSLLHYLKKNPNYVYSLIVSKMALGEERKPRAYAGFAWFLLRKVMQTEVRRVVITH